ncbi:mitogen-activated protein kinase kinase kinase 7-interacting protein 3 homolog isoform X2 [Stegodyphus dumicola]|uniref:mitogen-activated protein kinase kinase kinase 7-interacting protein 3 homolog isoform X2 n=1 Tax=Stegodyphus dumicola TaxID=202533 RepID=UPI0015AE8FE1|nr:mitogen-activated protein kinase kinase kinase 7-interacting protein 3 homolog isoform X2 [Stegodyphus dumicola]
MASRDIANMHLFLEMKKTFPDLPEDTLRNYVFLYAQDQDKCIDLLRKESENHFHPSQPFSDFRLPESKTLPKKSDYGRTYFDANEYPTLFSSSKFQNRSLLPNVSKKSNEHQQYSDIQQPTSGRSTSHAGVVHLPRKSENINVPLKPEARSAPVIAEHEQPFTDMYRHIPVSSHTTLCQMPVEHDNYNRMMFSTTKEHTILPVDTSRPSDSASVSPETEQRKRHAVKLSITPSFPFSQQQHQINVYNSPVCATASHSSRPGRHTTSLNFQLQPQSSNQYPLEISTVPTNIGDPGNFQDYGSHVQISVDSQGATFTALRLQRPAASQNYTSKVSSAEPVDQNLSQLSSQTQNSKRYPYNNRILQTSASPSKAVLLGTMDSLDAETYPKQTGNVLYSKCPQSTDFQSQLHFPVEHFQDKLNVPHGYHASPDYIQAVKNHQIAQLNMVIEELKKEKELSAILKAEVNRMEQDVIQRRMKKTSFPYAEELKKLREENRKLRVECNCLLMEVDVCSPGQIPLGMTDEDFYKNIFTGPNGTVASSSNQVRKTSNPESSSTQAKQASPLDDEDDDEKNRWKCKKCTFANHPALEKCEMCELPKNSGSFFDDS